MSGLSHHYISRALISLVLGGLLAFTGASWWMAVLAGVISFMFFLWAPHSGRYAVRPEYGGKALRRDERTQVINSNSARNGFVAVILAAAIYFDNIAQTNVPVLVLQWILIMGGMVYFLSDFWLRRI